MRGWDVPPVGIRVTLVPYTLGPKAFYGLAQCFYDLALRVYDPAQSVYGLTQCFHDLGLSVYDLAQSFYNLAFVTLPKFYDLAHVQKRLGKVTTRVSKVIKRLGKVMGQPVDLAQWLYYLDVSNYDLAQCVYHLAQRFYYDLAQWFCDRTHWFISIYILYDIEV